MLPKLKTAAALLASSISLSAFSADLVDVKFSKAPNNMLEAVLVFDEEAPSVSSFIQKNSTEINLTMPDTTNSTGRRSINVENIGINRAMLLSDESKTRLVLGMAGRSSYEMLTRGNEVTLLISSDVATSAPMSELASISSGGKSSDGLVNDFDMRRGEQGEAALIFDLSKSNADVDVQKQGSNVIVSIPNFSIPKRLLATHDVLDFGTPAKSVEFVQAGADTKIRIKTHKAFDMSAYQTNGQLVVNLAGISKAEEQRRSEQKKYTGERLSFNFQNVEVKAMLQLIAEVNNLNLVVGSDIEGTIALRLVDVPWDQALDVVLKTKGLDKRVNNNVLYVARAEEIALQEAVALENEKKLEGLAPLFTEHFEVNYADAGEMVVLFQSMGGDEESSGSSGLLSERGTAVVDERTNSIIMTDTALKLEEFRDLLSKLDVPIAQVSIEARIVIASDDFSKDLGVRWGFDGVRTSSGGSTAQIGAGAIDGTVEVANSIIDPDYDGSVIYGSEPGGLVVDLAANPSVANATTFAVGLLKGNGNFLTLELSALEAEGKGEVISQPKVVVGSQQTAYIQSGKEIAYQKATSSGATSVEFKEATLKLEVTPLITPDNRIVMQLNINKDSIGEVVAGVPTLDVTQLETQVIANNGETVVLGGIFEQSMVEFEAKTPILGDIPFLGRLFKTTSRESEKQETLIFITPRILEEPTQ